MTITRTLVSFSLAIFILGWFAYRFSRFIAKHFPNSESDPLESEPEPALWWQVQHVEDCWKTANTIAPESVEFLLKIAKERYPNPYGPKEIHQ